MHSFASYTNLSELGRGGMSIVYRATEPGGRTVALKVLAMHLAADPTAQRRFANECRVLRALNHPNIVRLIAADASGTPPFIAMEYVEGQTLDKLVTRAGTFTPRAFAPILIDIGYALDYAHGQSVVHRDIKPSNILVRAENGRAMLMDFGVAVMPDFTAFTATHARVGSVFYMSPEQVEGRIEITPASDIYSLGVTAYVALTGNHPFEGTNDIAIARKHLDQIPAHVSDLNSAVPRAVGDVVMQALEKLTYKRQASAGLFARQFRDAAAAGVAKLAATMPDAAPDVLTHGARSTQSAGASRRVESNAPSPAGPAAAQTSPAPIAPESMDWPRLFKPIALLGALLLCCAILAVGSSVLNTVSLPALSTATAGVPPMSAAGQGPDATMNPMIETIATDLARSGQSATQYGDPGDIATSVPFVPTAASASEVVGHVTPAATYALPAPWETPTLMPRPLPPPEAAPAATGTLTFATITPAPAASDTPSVPSATPPPTATNLPSATPSATPLPSATQTAAAPPSQTPTVMVTITPLILITSAP